MIIKTKSFYNKGKFLKTSEIVIECFYKITFYDKLQGSKMLQSSLIFKKKIESDWNTYDIFLKDLWKTLLRMYYKGYAKIIFLVYHCVLCPKLF